MLGRIRGLSRWFRDHRSTIWRDLRPTIKLLSVVALCYLSALAAVNLLSTSIGSRYAFLFPHIGPSSSLDTSSLDQAWGTIQREYVIRGVDGSVGTQGAEQGMIEQLRQKYSDRFSDFLSAQDYQTFNGQLHGQRSGSVGIALEGRCAGGAICPSGQSPTEVVITDVLHNQPAEKAGIHEGDVLVAVGGTQMSSLGSAISDEIDKAGPLIRGDAGTSVAMTVERGPATLTLTVTRADLQIPSVYSQMLGSVLYIQITGMDSDTPDALRNVLQQNAASASGIVLDLRENPGGLVDTAVAVASEFVSPGQGRQDVLSERGRMTSADNPQSAQDVTDEPIKPGGLALQQKLVVLVDGNTASAAEIVTASLHDYHRATVIGTATFGKGSEIRDFPLSDGSVLHLIVDLWYGPAGENIDGKGVTPDQTVQLDSPDHRFRLDAQSPPEAGDLQLQAALQRLGG